MLTKKVLIDGLNGACGEQIEKMLTIMMEGVSASPAHAEAAFGRSLTLLVDAYRRGLAQIEKLDLPADNLEGTEKRDHKKAKR